MIDRCETPSYNFLTCKGSLIHKRRQLIVVREFPCEEPLCYFQPSNPRGLKPGQLSGDTYENKGFYRNSRIAALRGDAHGSIFTSRGRGCGEDVVGTPRLSGRCKTADRAC